MNLESLKQRFGLSTGPQLPSDWDLIRIHDTLMVEYGWIPLEEFKALPIPTMINLLEAIKERHKAEEKQMKRKR